MEGTPDGICDLTIEAIAHSNRQASKKWNMDNSVGERQSSLLVLPRDTQTLCGDF